MWHKGSKINISYSQSTKTYSELVQVYEIEDGEWKGHKTFFENFGSIHPFMYFLFKYKIFQNEIFLQNMYFPYDFYMHW